MTNLPPLNRAISPNLSTFQKTKALKDISSLREHKQIPIRKVPSQLLKQQAATTPRSPARNYKQAKLNEQNLPVSYETIMRPIVEEVPYVIPVSPIHIGACFGREIIEKQRNLEDIVQEADFQDNADRARSQKLFSTVVAAKPQLSGTARPKVQKPCQRPALHVPQLYYNGSNPAPSMIPKKVEKPKQILVENISKKVPAGVDENMLRELLAVAGLKLLDEKQVGYLDGLLKTLN